MARWFSAFVVAIVVLGILGFNLDTGLAEEESISLTDLEQRVVDLVNAERLKVNVQPLTVSGALVLSARRYAAYMASANFFSHDGPDGSTLVTRSQAAGYGGYSYLAENLAAGQTTPDAATAGWMASPGHRANMLSDRVVEIGVGYFRGGSYGHYWVQEFGTPASAPRVLSFAMTPGWTSPLTGKTVSANWLSAYSSMGGLDNLGHPRSGVIADPAMGGQTVQYFQRAILELHPENPAPYRIIRRLLGDVLYPGADAPVSSDDTPRGPNEYFPVSTNQPTGLGHFVADFTRSGQAIYFKRYFDTHGGVTAFGFPKEEPKLRGGRWTQRFQAGLFEYHAENDRDGVVAGSEVPLRNYRVQLALLGDEFIAQNRLELR